MTSLASRPKDLLYFVFFAIHLPLIFLVDAAPLLPAFLQSDLSHHLRAFYAATYQDKFFQHPAPAWFSTFIWLELVYHAPLSVWALKGLIQEHPLLPLHLLVFALEAALSSLACLAEVWSWPDRSSAQKWHLTALYAPYVALGAFMAADMFARLRSRLLQSTPKPKST